MKKRFAKRVVERLHFQIKCQKGLETRITNSAGINRREFKIEKFENMPLGHVLLLARSLLMEDESLFKAIALDIKEQIELDIDEETNNPNYI